MKRRWSIAITVIVFNLILAACTSSPESDAKKENAVTIKVFAQQESSLDLATNDFTKELERRFNVEFDWTTVPYEGAKEKRQISLASGKYADAYILTAYIDQFSQEDLLRYGKQGVIVPLNDLIDQYAPHIKKAMDENETLRAYSTAPDGKIYGLVSYSECYHCSYSNKMWLNTKWLEKLDLKMPATTDEFKKVLEAFKTRDPNGNGIADEIPLSGSIEDFGVRIIPFLMNGFIYDDDRKYLSLKNGKVDTVADKPEWREGLTYIKSLYDEGLIDPGAFTQNADAYWKIGENADAQILGAGAALHPAIFVDTGPGNTRGRDYNPVPPLAGPHASFAVLNNIGIDPGAKFVITDKASEEARIALIKIADYMFTPEGQAHAEVGKEGVDWRKPTDGEQALNPDVAPAFTRIPQKKWAISSNTGWSGMGHLYMPKEYRDSWTQVTDIYSPEGYERRLQEATLLYEGKEPEELFPIWSVWIDSKDADEASFLQNYIKNYIEENALEFVTGNKSLSEDWEEYVKGLKDMKISRYLEILQKAYDRSLKTNKN
ncbi:extracellular solute-binding protein [Cohnella lupini]|uniref:Putative aldouronate transport system substrate-binding protein n=1 Tax=Cohnella lupini TaxID=1294267 RepID=A0A3D9INW7_9BACL|nr:extracellular solute-binding protein [Cohnella lupini]RED63199.1 putative aldouronate transport system substrate-binding protein [Cohnella lupini]